MVSLLRAFMSSSTDFQVSKSIVRATTATPGANDNLPFRSIKPSILAPLKMGLKCFMVDVSGSIWRLSLPVKAFTVQLSVIL